MEQQTAQPEMTVIRGVDEIVEEFQPKIEAMICTYCTYAAADLAGSQRLQYPHTVQIVKYPCTGRVSIVHILKAFEVGADAVLVGGCEVGSCHFVEGNLRATERVAYAKKLLAETGLGGDRLEMFYISASDSHGFVSAVNEMTDRAKKMGPNPLKVSGYVESKERKRAKDKL